MHTFKALAEFLPRSKAYIRNKTPYQTEIDINDRPLESHSERRSVNKVPIAPIAQVQ